MRQFNGQAFKVSLIFCDQFRQFDRCEQARGNPAGEGLAPASQNGQAGPQRIAGGGSCDAGVNDPGGWLSKGQDTGGNLCWIQSLAACCGSSVDAVLLMSSCQPNGQLKGQLKCQNG